MSFNPFSWLRNAARNAILGGVGDAIQILQPAGDSPDLLTLDDLRERLALPAPETEEPARKKK